jgi:DNA-binding transcriptional LysR family regulator
VEGDVVAGRLRRLFEGYSVNPLDQTICVYAAYLPNRRHSRKVHVLLEFLQQQITNSVHA